MCTDLKIGVIGCGTIGIEHILRITNKINGARIAGVADIDIKRAEEAAGLCGADIYKSDKALIESENIEAVIVATPSDAHERAVLDTVRAGKFCFCEKPLADTFIGCRKIVEEEMAGKRQLVQVGFMRHYDAGYKKLKAILHSRQLGQPLILHAAHKDVERDETFTTQMLITEAAIHEIEIIRWLLDDFFTTVQIIKPRRTKYAKPNQDDPLLIILRTSRDMIAEIEISLNAKFAYDIQCEVTCEEGIATMPQPADLLLRMEGVRGIPLQKNWKNRFIQAFDEEMEAWVGAVRNKAIDGPSAWDGYLAAITTEACLKALESGNIEKIPSEQCPFFYNRDDCKLY